MEYSRDNLLDVVRTLFKWKKPIIYICVATALLTAALSLMMPNYYEGSTTFYAASQTLQDPNALFGEGNKDFYYYGGGDDIDRLIQASNSNELFHFMTEKFDLYDRYGIKPDEAKASSKLRMEFYGHFKIVKTERDVLVLSVEDKAPEVAASMANIARDKIGEIANQIIRFAQQEMIKAFETQIKDKEAVLKTVSDSLTFMRIKYGIFDPTYQRNILGRIIPGIQASIASETKRLEIYKKRSQRDSANTISARIAGMEGKLEAIMPKNDSIDLHEGIRLVDELYRFEQSLMGRISSERVNFQKQKFAFAQEKPALFIQDHAEIPDMKSRPKRSIWVIGATMLAFLFSVLGVLILEYNRDVDWKSIVNAK